MGLTLACKSFTLGFKIVSLEFIDHSLPSQTLAHRLGTHECIGQEK